MSSKSPGPKRKQLIVKVLMLDDSEIPFQIESKTTGNELINSVYQYLKLIESDYFGLEFIDSKGKKCWLDYDKSVSKQIQNNYRLIFCVKFYTPDPGQLEEEYTRYLYALQVKRDLAEGLLLCSDATASLLASYILQAEAGDYTEGYNSSTYFQNKKFFPHQNEDHEAKILDYYKNHIGQSPADADLNLLDIARKIELYGIIMHPAKDHEGVQLNLAVAHMGILVFQNFTKINTFSWAKIRKLSFKRKKFLVKLHPENYGFYKDTVEFYFDNRDDSKNFWKKCIEHHSFFRCISAQRMPRQKSKLLTRGSSFRYYGRTQKELIETAREHFGKNRSFDRSYHSMRSISQFASGNNNHPSGYITGTQSLNRNLASRSTGAILGSNDSVQNFHHSAHHLSYHIPSSNQPKIQSANSSPSLHPEEPVVKNHNHHHLDNDSSTHGSRTIDSRYSRDKTLGLSDEDVEENEEEEEEEEEDNEEETDQCTCGKKHEPIPAKNASKLSDAISNMEPLLSSNNLNNNTSSFKNSKQISLPIQQQQAQKEIEINVNPNKIYSRKEVITTYKEETKTNTHLTEEIHQTTYLDANSKAGTSSSSFKAKASSPINNLSQQQVSQVSILPQSLKSTTSSTTTTTLTSSINLLDTNNQEKELEVNQVEEEEEENDNDDEVQKNDRASLAAKIIYSNLQKQQQHQQQLQKTSYERVKRPLSLIKPVVTSIKDETIYNTVYSQPKQQHQQIVKKYIKPPIQPKPNMQLMQSAISQTNYVSELADSDEKFPTPPPIPSLKTQPVILQDYQQPLFRPNKQNNTYFQNVEDEFKKKKIPLEESYCIVKELVMTERTYKKDLDLLTQSFRQFAVTNNFDLSELLVFDQLLYPQALEPIHEFHTQFLKDLELRLFYWTDKNNGNFNNSSHEDKQKIGDLILNLNFILKNYQNYIEKYEEILIELEQACKRNKKFDSLFKEFETQKICYLPFTMFLLKPIQRLIHYKILFERLLIFYGTKHHDYSQTYGIFEKIDEINDLINEKLTSIENKQKLIELQRDLTGADQFLSPGSKYTRYFVREGSLQKLSRKGYQQRMFFLFNDLLLYCARSSSAVLQFKVHGEYHLRHVQVEDGNPHINIPNSFTIYSSSRSILVSAVSQEEKSKWLQDLYEAIEKSRSTNEEKLNYSSLKSNSSSDNNLDATDGDDENCENNDSTSDAQNNSQASTEQKSQQQHRANTTMHVCWHRNTSVSAIDNHRSVVNQLSGYLLRKFKNSNGWQKLWVVFTNFCLFFYKTYQDEFPLASLPLLGYTVTVPSECDNINKDFVFKLKFKNHVYFFRAETQYSYDRWLEVIESAAQKQCLFNPNE